MKNLANLTTDSDDTPVINLSPLIDMVFLLLIFFMVTTVFVEETGVDVQKPTAASGESLKKNSIMIAITANNKIIYGGQEIGINGVRGLVSRLLQEKELPVIIIADSSVATGITVDVIDECKLAGATRVSIAAEKE